MHFCGFSRNFGSEQVRIFLLYRKNGQDTRPGDSLMPPRDGLFARPYGRLRGTFEDAGQRLGQLLKGLFLLLGDRPETHRQVQGQAKERFLAGRNRRRD